MAQETATLRYRPKTPSRFSRQRSKYPEAAAYLKSTAYEKI
jgi:hypothetical protein